MTRIDISRSGLWSLATRAPRVLKPKLANSFSLWLCENIVVVEKKSTALLPLARLVRLQFVRVRDKSRPSNSRRVVRKNEPRCAIHVLGPVCSTAAPTARMPEDMPMRMASRAVAPGASASATSVPAMRSDNEPLCLHEPEVAPSGCDAGLTVLGDKPPDRK